MSYKAAILRLVLLALVVFGGGPGKGLAAEPDKEGVKDEFRVLDISERTLDGGPAIAVLLSAPLDAKLRHDDHLRISDAVKPLKSAWVLSDDGRVLYFTQIEPETEYTVTVLESLTAADQRKVAKRMSQAVTTRKITPAVSFAGEGMILPKQLTDGLPVAVVNVSTVGIDFFRLHEHSLAKFVSWRNITGRKGYYDLKDVKKYGELVFSGTFALAAPRNKRVIRHIPVEDIPAVNQPGVYMAILREPGDYDYSYETTYFMVTDIALHVRIYDKESLVIASSLKTALPLPAVQLTVFDNNGKAVKEGVTDANGQYRYPGKLTGMSFIKAALAEQISVLPLKIPALDLSDFNLGGRIQQPREVFTYSPRDLYRPGEEVVVSALLRDYDGRPVKAMPLKARLFRPDGKEVQTFTWYAEKMDRDNLNYFQTTLKLPLDAQTGIWVLEIKDDPSAARVAGEFRFHVEEFLPERMKLDLSTPTAFVAPADPIEVAVDGQYLYGAPAAGNDLSTRVVIRALREFEPWKGFQFGDVQDSQYEDSFELDDQQLDAEGKALIAIDSRWDKLRSPLSVRVIVSLFEKGGRPVVRRVTQTVRPASALVGIRPLFEEQSVEAGPLDFEIVKTDAEGNAVPASNLMVELIKEDRDYYWEYNEHSGWSYQYSEKKYQYLTDSLKLSGGKPEKYTLQLQRGMYVLNIRDVETELISSVRFHVGYWGYGDNEGTTARPDKVILKPDQPSYRPGDLIRLTVLPPHNGNAALLVEGKEPLWSARVDVSTQGTIVEIPVSAKWDGHDLYISAVVFRPADAKEKITPNRAVGLVHIPLNRAERKIAVSLEAPEKMAPDNPLTVKFKINPAQHKDVYITLAAVDLGILNITDFKTPDPFNWFFEQRRYDVLAYDFYNKVIESLMGAKASLKYGGDADLMGGKRPDAKVKLVSLFQGPTAVNEQGEAVIVLDIPDFNGRLRLMAVAFSPDGFGSIDTEITVAAPVVTQLAMPRFMAPLDSSEFTLDVHNLSGQAQSLTLSLTVDGPLQIEQGEQKLSLADGRKTSLRFPVTAQDMFGVANIRLDLQGTGISLKRDWQLGVRPGYPGITQRHRKVLREGETFSLDQTAIENLMPNTVSAGLTISTVASMNLDEVMKGLIQYPYGCLEQTSSRAYPLLYADAERIRRYRLPEISHKDRAAQLDQAISKLASMQLATGGFALWHGGGPEQYWLTVYVADFLLSARDMGFSVPAEMLDRVMTRLEAYLNQKLAADIFYGDQGRDHINIAIKAYSAYVLARVNRAPLGTLRALWDNHGNKSASGLPLAHLGVALKRMGDARRSEAALTAAVSKRVPKYGYWEDYSSLLRDLAWTVALLIEAEAHQVDGFEQLMLDLEDEVRHRRWFSTQEKFAVFRAGIALSGMAATGWRGQLSIGDKVSPLDHVGEYSLRLDRDTIAQGIRFTSEAKGVLFVSAAVSGYTLTPPAEESTQIDIRRELFDIDGNSVTGNEFRVGDLYLAHLRVYAQEWLPDAMVVDFLPAGFEIENQNLKHGFKLDDIVFDEQSIEQLRDMTQIVHEEFRDDRYVAVVQLHARYTNHLFYLVRVVSPGRFVVPPPMAESMYRPEVRGIGKTPEPMTVINRAD